MRADAVWPAVWGTCFAVGIIVGWTADTNMPVGARNHSLRGSGSLGETIVPSPKYNLNEIKHAGKDEPLSHKPVGVAENIQGQEENETLPEDSAGPDTVRRALLDRNEDAPVVIGSADLEPVYWKTAAHRIRDLNGGLWGPSEEELHELLAFEQQAPGDVKRSTQHGDGIRLTYTPAANNDNVFGESYLAVGSAEASAMSTIERSSDEDEWDYSYSFSY